MKVKALRYKDTKEFVQVEQLGEEPQVFTSDLPEVQPETATLELMKKIFEDEDYYEGLELDWERLELVEFDLIETGVVGADIRNKLSPPKGLVSMIRAYFNEKDAEKKTKLQKYIEAAMEQTEISVKYLSELL